MRTFDTGATRNDNLHKPDFEGYLSPFALEEFGRYMLKHSFLEDGTRRASDNWWAGIPKEEYMKSLWRHFLAAWKAHRQGGEGEVLVEALCGIIFNSQGYLHELTKPVPPHTEK